VALSGGGATFTVKSRGRIDTLEEICSWLGVSIHDLMPKSSGETRIGISGMMVTDQEEQEVVIGYRNADDLDKALVRRTLGLDRKARGGREEASSAS